MIYGGLAALVVVVLVLSSIFPIFMTCILTIASVSLAYVLTENMWTHDAAEFENRFWTAVAFSLAYTVIFVSDSPLVWRTESNSLKWLLCSLITYVAHNYDRHLRRMVLKKMPNIKRIRSVHFEQEYRITAKQKVQDIRRSLEAIDLPWMSSAIQGIFSLPQVLIAERQILGILEDCAQDELNLVVMNIELGLIFYKTKDHRFTRQMHRTKLLKLLCVDRITELNTPARAMVLDGLQRMKLSAHAESEYYIKNIIMKTKQDDLSELKTLTDSKGDFHSLHKLIYVDIKKEAVRSEIIEYIANQAAVQAAHNKMGTRKGKARAKQFAWRKILSDVDDTLMCSAGSFPSGVDGRYPKHAIYPGVLAFYRELDIGTSGSDSWDDSRVGNPIAGLTLGAVK